MTDAVKMAKDALRPFAETFAEAFVDEDGWKSPMAKERIVDWFGPSDFRGAVQALAALEQAGEPVAAIGPEDEADYAELKRLYNFSDNDSAQFTRWNMLTAIRHGQRLSQEFDAGEVVACPKCSHGKLRPKLRCDECATVFPHPPQSRVAAEPVGLREALEWYGEQARLCRLIHSEGDAGRHALQDDGGKRAQSVLATPSQPDPQSREPSLTVADAWQDLVDKDDRTSPEEYPDMALITREELADYMSAAAPSKDFQS